MAAVIFNSIIQLQFINCFENLILIVDITRLGIQWYTSPMQNCMEELFCSLNIQVLEVFMECGGTAISVSDSRESRFEGLCCFNP